MKKTITLFCAFLLLISSDGNARNFDEDYDKIKNEITKTLVKITLDDELLGNVKFDINLTVDTENRIIVSDVISQSNTLKRNVKAALSKMKINAGDLIIGKNYVFTIFFKIEE
jgi:CobQ-like glutamine amidotransferase family enzyme